MRRAWIAVLAVAAMAIPGVAFANGDDGSPSSKQNASKVCKALRADMGVELFRTTYGTNHNRHNAHGKCVSKHRHAVRGLIAQAINECKAQRESMRLRHGRDDNPSKPDRSAFRACVKEKLRALLAERRAAVEAAVKTCETERTADPVAFREKYGRGEQKRHAFFRCVVVTFRANEEAKPTS